jgi:ESS family glutamate:Na+ symporter
MNIPFPFDPLLCFGWLSIALLVGVLLRATVPFFQKFLFPGCLIGGILGLAAMHLGMINLSVDMLEGFAYHLFIISFISLGLTPGEQSGPGTSKEIARGGLWMALVEGVTLPMQAIIGGLVIMALGYIGVKLFPTFGFLVSLGFTEGPGQALSIGKVWEGFGFQFAATIGLTFAAAGYLVAVFLGVPLANRGVRKGQARYLPRALPMDFIRGLVGRGDKKEPAGYQTTNSSNIDTLALHFALVGLVYILTYHLVKFVAGLLSADMADMLWGFFFFAGLLVALLVRLLMTGLNIAYTIDPGVQRRVTGWAVDYLIVATMMAIQLVVVKEFIVPVSIIIVLATVSTAWIVFYLGRRLWSNQLERTLAIFGTCTGTVSTGLLLLRIVDPEFKTGTALELGFMNVFVAPIVLGSMLLLNAPILWGWSLGLTMLVFAAIMAASLLGLKILTTWVPKRIPQSCKAPPTR